MWEFVDRLVSIAIPRIRDFRGLNPRAFDGRGNYSVGIREQLIFPEIDYDSIDEVRGLDVTITTSAKTDEEAFELLLGLGFPFSAEGRPGEVDHEAEEEEQRREEARQRAEAEAAALEQLKEENPEAYAKRVRPEEEEGLEGEPTPSEEGQPRNPTLRPRIPRNPNRQWRRLHKLSVRGESRSTGRGGTTAVGAAAARARTTASSASAGCACASSPTRATSPE